ncbi:hypothetical protein GF420_04310 [candidate division GN15 bacterium]|nr:hypothetical protein [candidate division GN15 bacterium]
MRVLNKLLGSGRRPTPANAETPDPVSASLDAVESPVRPRRKLAWGRWLSFAISDESIEMAAVQRRGSSVRVLEVRKIYTTGDLVNRENRADYLCHAIEEFVTQFGGRHPRLVLVVNGPETALRTFEMPALSGSKLGSAVLFEAKKRIPFPIRDCYYDYRVTAELKRGKAKRLRVSLLAATRRLIDEQLGFFERLELTVHHIYSAYDTIGQLLPSVPEYRPDANFALINIERGGTHISYYRGADLQFYHITSLGSSQLANRADENRFADFADLLAREIQNSLDYYTGQYATHFTNTVYVYGDLAYTDELVKLLQDQFGFEFRVFPDENLDRVDHDGSRVSSTLAVCLQTAAAAACPIRLANMLPAQQVERQRRRLQHRFAAAALVVLASILGLTSLTQYNELRTIATRNETIQSEVSAFEQSDLFANYQVAKQLVASNREYIEQIAERPSYLGFNFKELTRLTPRTVLLRQLDYAPGQNGRNLTLIGVISRSEIPPEVVLAEYVEALRKSRWYGDVTVDRHVKRIDDRETRLEFTLSMRGQS